MNDRLNSDEQPQLSRALDKMIEALRILDEIEAPGNIGSHLDLAIAKLEERLDPGHPSASIGTLLTTLSEVRADLERQRGNLARPWGVDGA